MISSEAQREKNKFCNSLLQFNNNAQYGRVVQEIKEVMNNSMNKYDYEIILVK